MIKWLVHLNCELCRCGLPFNLHIKQHMRWTWNWMRDIQHPTKHLNGSLFLEWDSYKFLECRRLNQFLWRQLVFVMPTHDHLGVDDQVNGEDTCSCCSDSCCQRWKRGNLSHGCKPRICTRRYIVPRILGVICKEVAIAVLYCVKQWYDLFHYVNLVQHS